MIAHKVWHGVINQDTVIYEESSGKNTVLDRLWKSIENKFMVDDCLDRSFLQLN